MVNKLYEIHELIGKIQSAFHGKKPYVLIGGSGEINFNNATQEYLEKEFPENNETLPNDDAPRYIILDETYIVFSPEFERIDFFFRVQKNTFTFSSIFKKPFNGKTKNEKVSEVLNIPPMHTKILELFPCNIEDDDEVEIIKFTIYKFASEKLSSVPIPV